MRTIALSLALLLALAGRAAAAAPFASLAELDAGMAEVERGGDADAFWARVVAAGTMPLTFDRTAVFLHRSKAAKVEWRSDFTGWRSSPDAAGRRLGKSDIFTFRRDFEPATRLDYKIVEGDDGWLLDPLNPHQQLGGFGPNSELRMPGWTPPPHVVRRPDVPRGRLGPPETIHSRKLGYDVAVRVYEPAGKPAGKRPMLYVTDGSDYWNDEMGALVITLDNLIAERRIPPLWVVFIDPWDLEHGKNRRDQELVPAEDGSCRFCEFVTGELLPRVERGRGVDAARRGLLGTSLGGAFAALMEQRHPGTFPLLAIHSPAPRVTGKLLETARANRRPPLRVAMSAGLYEENVLAVARRLRDAYLARHVTTTLIEVPDGHSWGHWRATAAPLLELLFAAR